MAKYIWEKYFVHEINCKQSLISNILYGKRHSPTVMFLWTPCISGFLRCLRDKPKEYIPGTFINLFTWKLYCRFREKLKQTNLGLERVLFIFLSETAVHFVCKQKQGGSRCKFLGQSVIYLRKYSYFKFVIQGSIGSNTISRGWTRGGIMVGWRNSEGGGSVENGGKHFHKIWKQYLKLHR